MKRCPECRRTYPDETLNFCLDDGEWLHEITDPGEPATAILTSESATRVQSVAEAPPVPSSKSAGIVIPGRKLLMAGGLGILLFAALGIGAYWIYSGGTSKQIESIAVMPFINESGNADLEYLSDGISESLINSLSTLPNLSVKARNTVFRYKGKEIDERSVGRELSVQAVLFGRFTQRGDALTLSLSLVDSGTGNTLWGEQYDRKIQDLTVLRNDIACDVAQKLRNRLSSADTKNLTKNYTANPEALRLYFNGRYLWSKRTTESVRKSIGYFNQAIDKDPNFALAYSGLADAYVVPVIGMPPRDVMPKAKAAATRALEIDDALAEAHTSLARVLQSYEWNWAEAEMQYQRAIELDSRYPLAHQWYGGFLERIGRTDEGISERRIAVELDPESASVNFELGLAYFFARDYDRGIAQFQKTLELQPGFPSAIQVLLASYAQKGQFDLAIEKIQEIQENNTLWPAGQVYAMAGRREDAQRVLKELERSRLEYDSGSVFVSATSIAFIYAALGENDKAIEWLEKGYEERAFQMQFLKIDPRWDKIRDDPRFHDLMKRVGLPPD